MFNVVMCNTFLLYLIPKKLGVSLKLFSLLFMFK